MKKLISSSTVTLLIFSVVAATLTLIEVDHRTFAQGEKRQDTHAPKATAAGIGEMEEPDISVRRPYSLVSHDKTFAARTDSIPDLVLTGEEEGDYFGWSVASAGDVNRDRYADFMVGAPNNDAGGNLAGRVYIYYGGPIVDSIADIVITGDTLNFLGTAVACAGDVNGDGYSDVIIDDCIFFGGNNMDAVPDVLLVGEEPDERFGCSVASAGDLNGDGYDDVIVGAREYWGSRREAGRVYIYFGGESMDGVADVILDAEDSYDNFGASVAGAGDVNHDYYSDVVVGAPYSDVGGTDAGRAYIYYGGYNMDTTADVILTGEEAWDHFGSSVAFVRQLESDWNTLIFVGAPNNDCGGTDAGRTYVYYGGVSMDTVADIILTGEAASDVFGGSVATAGDVDREWLDDIVVAAWGNDANGENAGGAYIYLGGSRLDDVADVMLAGEAPDDMFGLSVAGAGDVDGDRFADVIVGAPRNDAGGENAGRAYLYLEIMQRGSVYVDSANTSGVEDGSQAHPFNTIQEGIDAATSGDTVRVAPGTYEESLVVICAPSEGKDLVLLGSGPDTTIVKPPIDKRALTTYWYSHVRVQRMGFHGLGNSSIGVLQLYKGGRIELLDFEIIGFGCALENEGEFAEVYAERGTIAQTRVGVYKGWDSGAVHLRNILFHNIGTAWGGAGIWIDSGTVEIVNCTFAYLSLSGDVEWGAPAIDGSAGFARVCNTIIWRGQGAIEGDVNCEVEYSCFGNLQAGLRPYYQDIAHGGTNLPEDTDPMFVHPHYPDPDYHLRQGSPCIDTGDPNDDYSQEPQPNGGRINMGAYGNTPEATPSVARATLVLPDTATDSGSTLAVPIFVSTDSTIALAQFVVEFDSTCVKFQNARVGPDAPGFSVSVINPDLPFSPSLAGINENVLVQISGGGSAWFSGPDNQVALLDLLVTGAPGDSCPLGFDTDATHTFLTTTNLTDIGENNILFQNGSIAALNTFSVSGYVRYCTAARPIPQTEVLLDDELAATTDAAGYYETADTAPGSCAGSARKTNDTQGAISGADALAVLKHLAFLPPPLTECKLQAADVTQDGDITGSDAIAILRYLAFFTTGIGNTGEWIFDPTSVIVSGPPDVTQDFVGNLLGDVTQDWSSASANLVATYASAETAPASTTLPKENAVTERATSDLSPRLEKISSWQSKATITLPDTTHVPGSGCSVPILVTTDSVIALAQCVIEYDSTVLRLDSVTVGKDVNDFSIMDNRSLPFAPSCVTAKNVLVQICSPNPATGFRGDSIEVTRLYFFGIGSEQESSPLRIDPDPTRTFLTTPSLYDLRGEDILFINGQVVLPVELESFEAQVDGNCVKLTWSLTSETNNVGFDIERSADGHHFVKIGFVEDQGSTSRPSAYNFADTDLELGTYYYRLRQIDENGRAWYSASIEVQVVAPKVFRLYQNYPNPFNAQTKIRYEIPKASHVTLSVLNVLGREICRLVDYKEEAGYYVVTWDGRDGLGQALSSGVYVVQLQTKESVSTKKIILAR